MQVIVSKSKPLDEFEQEFFIAARSSDKDKVMELLEIVDVNIKDDDAGRTALMNASMENKTKVVRLLLKADANPNIQDDFGYTALMYASQEGHIPIVELLLKAKANPIIKCARGLTALDLAERKRHTTIIQLLK